MNQPEEPKQEEEIPVCGRVVKHTEILGVVYKTACKGKLYKDGLCFQHWKRKQLKQTPWGERPEYREATDEDLEGGRSLKLKTENTNNIYRLQAGFIQKFKVKGGTEGSWLYTTIPVKPEKFCVKL